MVFGFTLQQVLPFLLSLATSEVGFREYGLFPWLSSFVSLLPDNRRVGAKGLFKF